MKLKVSEQSNKEFKTFLALPLEEQNSRVFNTLTGVPLVDIMVNIDWFTAHFDDRNKLKRILKDLFNNCEAMKDLLDKHGKLIMTSLMNKYDK